MKNTQLWLCLCLLLQLSHVLGGRLDSFQRFRGQQRRSGSTQRRVLKLKGKGTDTESYSPTTFEETLAPTDEEISNEYPAPVPGPPPHPSPTRGPTPVPTVRVTPAPTESPSKPPQTYFPTSASTQETSDPTSSPTASPTTWTEKVINEEAARTLPLLPFDIRVSGDFQVDTVEQAVEHYLYSQLKLSFEKLRWVLLTVTSEGTFQQRSALATYNITGEAEFIDAQDLPSELELQQAQLEALMNFDLFMDYVQSEGNEWVIEEIQLDGVIITEETITIGDTTLDNDANSVGREAASGSTSNAGKVILILLGVLLVLFAVAFVLRRTVRQRARKPMTYDSEPETFEGLVSGKPDSTGTMHPSESNAPNWGQVFALSQKSVEESGDDAFQVERKPKMMPPRERQHETVQLAAVREGDDDMSEYDMDEMSLPSDSGIRSGNQGYGQGEDLTMDLADFVSA